MFLDFKSQFNLDAAEQLVELGLFAPSIHCAYYSCFQLMKHKLNTCCNLSYDEINSTVSSSKTTEHKFVRDKIKEKLDSKIRDRRELRTIENEIKDLYSFRITSDYKNVQIDSSVAAKALSYSKEIVYYIKTNLK